MDKIAEWTKQVADHIKDWQLPANKDERAETFKKFAEHLATDPFYAELQKTVADFCARFPVPAAT